MRHRNKVKKLGKTASHRKAMLRNLLTSLFEHKKIITTEQKAKYARPFADKYITKAIKGDLANKRRIISFLMKREVAHDLINEIAFRYKDLPTGGYTRVIKLGNRQNDGASMAVLELVDPETRKNSKRKYPKHSHKVEEQESKNETKSATPDAANIEKAAKPEQIREGEGATDSESTMETQTEQIEDTAPENEA